jgi:hypothetical protein
MQHRPNYDQPTVPIQPVPVPPVRASGPQPGEFWPAHDPDNFPYVNTTRTHEPTPIPPDERGYAEDAYNLGDRLPRSREEHERAYGHGKHDAEANAAKELKKHPKTWYAHPGIKGGAIAAGIIATVIVWGNSIGDDGKPAGSPHLELPPTQEQLEPTGMRVPNAEFPQIDFTAGGDSHVVAYCTDTYVDDNTGVRYRNTIVTGSLEDDKFHKADFRQGEGRISVGMTQDTTRVIGGHWEYEDGKTGQYPANCYEVPAIAKAYPLNNDPNAPTQIRVVLAEAPPVDGTVVADGVKGGQPDFVLNVQLPPA